MRPRREIEVFSLSFLDLLSCGLGSIMLLFVLAATIVERQSVQELEEQRKSSEAARRESERLREKIGLLQADITARQSDPDEQDQDQASADVDAALGLATELQKEVDDLRARLEDAREPQGPGPRILRDPALLFLVDTSASMLGQTQEEVLKARQSGQRGTKWPRALAFVEQVLRENLASEYRVFTYSDGLEDLTDEVWKVASEEEIRSTLERLSSVALHGGSDLANALRGIAGALASHPTARVYLITDAPPNLPREDSKARFAVPLQRRKCLNLARLTIPQSGLGKVRWVVALLPWQDDPDAAERYWQDFLSGYVGSVVLVPD